MPALTRAKNVVGSARQPGRFRGADTVVHLHAGLCVQLAALLDHLNGRVNSHHSAPAQGEVPCDGACACANVDDFLARLSDAESCEALEQGSRETRPVACIVVGRLPEVHCHKRNYGRLGARSDGPGLFRRAFDQSISPWAVTINTMVVHLSIDYHRQKFVASYVLPARLGRELRRRCPAGASLAPAKSSLRQWLRLHVLAPEELGMPSLAVSLLWREFNSSSEFEHFSAHAYGHLTKRKPDTRVLKRRPRVRARRFLAPALWAPVLRAGRWATCGHIRQFNRSAVAR